MGHSTMGFNQSRRARVLLQWEELEALHTRLKGKTCHDRLVLRDKTTVTVTTFIFITITLFTIGIISMAIIIMVIVIITITIILIPCRCAAARFITPGLESHEGS